MFVKFDKRFWQSNLKSMAVQLWRAQIALELTILWKVQGNWGWDFSRSISGCIINHLNSLGSIQLCWTCKIWSPVLAKDCLPIILIQNSLSSLQNWARTGRWSKCQSSQLIFLITGSWSIKLLHIVRQRPYLSDSTYISFLEPPTKNWHFFGGREGLLK